MGILLQDIRYGFRTLLKSPWFTALAIVALALGIGANTAIFSLADAFLLKPLNIPDPEHLVIVGELSPGQITDINSISAANFADFRDQAKSFEPFGAFDDEEVNLTGIGLPEKVQADRPTANFFTLCSAQPLYGRTFLPGEDQPGHDGVVILSYRLWQRRFGGDPSVIGQDLHVDGKPHTIIGVMPRSFDFPMTTEIWMPLALEPKAWQDRKAHDLLGLGKLKPGVTVQTADIEMRAIAQRLAAAYPATNRGWSARAMGIRRFELGDETVQYTLMLFGAVGLVLLIVCANVANLQFVRGASRNKEMAIRVALGGSRWRLVRQLLTESVLVAIAGAIFSLAFAKWAISLIVANMPPEVAKYIPGWDQIRLDGRALVFTLLAGVIAGIIAGVLPAFQGSRLDVNETLKEGGRSSSSSRGHHLLRDCLVIAQIALAAILLAGSGLFVRGFRTLLNVNEEFQPDTLLSMRVNLPDIRYAKPEQQRLFFDQALERLAAIPGVQGAAMTTWLPYGNGGATGQFSIEGRPWRDASEIPTITAIVSSPNYIKLAHIPLIRGRELSDQDTKDSQLVVVISQSMDRKFWPAGDSIGHRIKLGTSADTTNNNPWTTIVGVVGDVKMDPFQVRPPYGIYRTYRQFEKTYGTFALRSLGDPMSLGKSAQAAVASVDPEEPAFEIMSMRKVINNNVIGLAYVAVMMGVIGAMALVLAAVGVFGVMAFVVTERTYEIGVRMAFGAQPGDVLRLIIGKGLLLTAIGLTIGIILALGGAWWLRNLIVGIGATDPATFGGITLTIVAVVLAACWFPARRATRVDPMIALRYE